VYHSVGNLSTEYVAPGRGVTTVAVILGERS